MTPEELKKAIKCLQDFGDSECCPDFRLEQEAALCLLDVCREKNAKMSEITKAHDCYQDVTRKILFEKSARIEKVESAYLRMVEQCEERDSKISELSAALIDSRTLYLLLLDVYPEASGWNLDDQDSDVQDKLRKDACQSLEMEEPLMLMQLRDQVEMIKKLEGFALSTCLEAGWDISEAREALEKIKGKDDRKV
jgi:hypothetical protein